MTPVPRLGDYELLGSLGAGAHGEVFRARKAGGPLVALKRLYRPLDELKPAQRDAFFNEIRAASRLDHPHAVRVLDFGDADGFAFVVMELVDGQSLLALGEQARTRRWPWPLAALVFRDLADALSSAHVQGILHGDVSPTNVLVGNDGAVKLIDFGLARLGGQRQPVRADLGTFQYLAPERIDGQPLSAASEQWALGFMLWQALVGEYPVPHTSPQALVLQLMELEHVDPPSRRVPGLPTELDLLLTQMTQRDPSARLPSLGEVARTLDSLLRLYKVNATPRALAAWLAGGVDVQRESAVKAGPKPPRQTTSFVGRRAQVEALLAALASEPVGVIAGTTASPGLGRTRLVLAALEALGEGRYLSAEGDVGRALTLAREAKGLVVVDDWPAEALPVPPANGQLWVVARQGIPGVPSFIVPPLGDDEVEALLAARAERPTELSSAIRAELVRVLGGNPGLAELVIGHLNVDGLGDLGLLSAGAGLELGAFSAFLVDRLTPPERRLLEGWPAKSARHDFEALESVVPGLDPLDALEALRRRFIVQAWEDAQALQFFLNPAFVWTTPP